MIDPIVDYIGQRIWPYVSFAGVMFVLLILTVVLMSYKVSRMNTT